MGTMKVPKKVRGGQARREFEMSKRVNCSKPRGCPIIWLSMISRSLLFSCIVSVSFWIG